MTTSCSNTEVLQKYVDAVGSDNLVNLDGGSKINCNNCDRFGVGGRICFPLGATDNCSLLTVICDYSQLPNKGDILRKINDVSPKLTGVFSFRPQTCSICPPDKHHA